MARALRQGLSGSVAVTQRDEAAGTVARSTAGRLHLSQVTVHFAKERGCTETLEDGSGSVERFGCSPSVTKSYQATGQA